MTPFHPLFIFSVLHLSLTALGQQIQVDTPSPIPQCGNVPITWSRGTGPFSLTIATTADANISSVEVNPVVQSSPYNWTVDLPTGTPFTIGVRDNIGNNGETPPITVQDSTNTSCLSDMITSSMSTASTSDRATRVPSTGMPTSVGTSLGSNQTGAPSPISSQSSSSSHHSQVPIIAGVVAGVLALLTVIVTLIFIQRRKDRRHHTSSRDELVRTFGSAKADLDSAANDDPNEMAIPEPYVYKSVSRGHSTNLALPGAENPRQSEASTSRSVESSRTVPSTLAARKGERYLPNDTTSPNDNTPGGSGSSQSRIQEEDIDRLAARMVAMMSSGRISDQAWTPGAPNAQRRPFDEGDDLPAAPPLYKDVARSSGAPHPSSG